jgi:exodeoxyribonuclease VII small subunit
MGDCAKPHLSPKLVLSCGVLMTEAVDIAALSFEQALGELEKIVAELESGQAPLERSIDVYERGAALKAHCEKKLEAARLRVEKIVVGAQGKVSAETADFS